MVKQIFRTRVIQFVCTHRRSFMRLVSHNTTCSLFSKTVLTCPNTDQNSKSLNAVKNRRVSVKSVLSNLKIPAIAHWIVGVRCASNMKGVIYIVSYRIVSFSIILVFECKFILMRTFMLHSMPPHSSV